MQTLRGARIKTARHADAARRKPKINFTLLSCERPARVAVQHLECFLSHSPPFLLLAVVIHKVLGVPVLAAGSPQIISKLLHQMIGVRHEVDPVTVIRVDVVGIKPARAVRAKLLPKLPILCGRRVGGAADQLYRPGG